MKAIPMLIMLALVIGAYAPVAFAATDFTLDWSGSGNVAGAFTATGTTASFSTGGSAILGSWDVVIGGQAYGVDYTTSDFGASFTGGGYISYLEESLDRATGSGVWSDATGSAYQNVLTNYAALYVFADDNQFLATGNYHAGHAIDNGANFAQWSATGSGTMTIFERIDSASYYGTTDWTFGGPGCGSYGTSVATFTGSGIFNLNAGSDNYLAGVIGTPYATPQPGWKMPSGGEYHATWYFDGGLIIPDFSLAGN